jgi:uncharacterized protein (DUF427 family)
MDMVRGYTELRHEPTEKRIRALAGDATVIDTTRALLVWRGEYPVPTWAVPESDVRGELPAGAAERIDDPALAGYLVLDFKAFDRWYEEDERNVAHPRDPFHRIDILRSSRAVRIERDGVLLAESAQHKLLFETGLPLRIYLPREDVRVPLAPSDKRTWCAYKGQASYWSAEGLPDIAWSYEEPLREAAEIRGLVAFFNELVDLTLDGEPRERPQTYWSPR